MKYKLITKETAILAKECGFDECTYSDCWVETLDGDIIHNDDRRSIPEHDRCVSVLSQPSQYQLQSWLRKTFDIHVNPIPNFKHKIGHYHLGVVFVNSENQIDTVIIKNKKGVIEQNKFFETYEDALENGLVKGLEISKTLSDTISDDEIEELEESYGVSPAFLESVNNIHKALERPGAHYCNQHQNGGRRCETQCSWCKPNTRN